MKFAPLLLLIAFTPFSAFADAKADATNIIELTTTHDLIEGSLSVMRPVLISAIQNDLQKQDINVSNPGLFFDVVMEEFIDEFLHNIRRQLVTLYLEEFTPEELEGMNAFYVSPAGQALIEKTPVLQQAQAKLGTSIGQNAAINALPRVRQRLIEENIDVTSGNKSMTQKLLDALK